VAQVPTDGRRASTRLSDVVFLILLPRHQYRLKGESEASYLRIRRTPYNEYDDDIFVFRKKQERPRKDVK